MKAIYFVETKDDDYGRCRTEIVETTKKHAEEYYYHIEVDKEDIEILKKYLPFVDFEEEQERDDCERFYGTD